jgi:hypothetical protein
MSGEQNSDPWLNPAQNFQIGQLTLASAKLTSNPQVDTGFTTDLDTANHIVVGRDDLEDLTRVINEQIAAGKVIPNKADDGNKQSGGDGGSTPLGSRSMTEAAQLYDRLKSCHDSFVGSLNAELAQLKVAADGLKIVADKFQQVRQRDGIGAQAVKDAIDRAAKPMTPKK